MFTGLVEAQGCLQRDEASQVAITGLGAFPDLLSDLVIGDSVAIDGVCLTVTQVLVDGFRADVSPETLSRSTLGQLRPRHRVNVERSLRVGAKVGGHFVTGHIDGVGWLEAVTQAEAAWNLSFRLPASLTAYLVEKGSIAVNGISLTIATVQDSRISVAVIPHSYQTTNLSQLSIGAPVNIEGDILGKYVARFLQTQPADQVPTASSGSAPHLDMGLDLAFLAEHGYS